MEVWAPGVVPTKLTRYSNISETIPTNNYWAPLTEQVEDSENKQNTKSTEELNSIIHKNPTQQFLTLQQPQVRESRGTTLYQQQKYPENI